MRIYLKIIQCRVIIQCMFTKFTLICDCELVLNNQIASRSVDKQFNTYVSRALNRPKIMISRSQLDNLISHSRHFDRRMTFSALTHLKFRYKLLFRFLLFIGVEISPINDT